MQKLKNKILKLKYLQCNKSDEKKCNDNLKETIF